MKEATWESYIAGPRWSLPEGAIQRFILDSGLNGRVALVYERRVTTFTRATIFFEVKGPALYIGSLQNAISRVANYY